MKGNEIAQDNFHNSTLFITRPKDANDLLKQNKYLYLKLMLCGNIAYSIFKLSKLVLTKVKNF